jgi:hypothetical protein
LVITAATGKDTHLDNRLYAGGSACALHGVPVPHTQLLLLGRAGRLLQAEQHNVNFALKRFNELEEEMGGPGAHSN